MDLASATTAPTRRGFFLIERTEENSDTDSLEFARRDKRSVRQRGATNWNLNWFGIVMSCREPQFRAVEDLSLTLSSGRAQTPMVLNRNKKVSAPVGRTNAKVSSLVELLRRRASQQPEQRIYTYLVDGETEGAHLTFEALDSQARAIGAMLQGYRASGERCAIALSGGARVHLGFLRMLVCRGYRGPSATAEYGPAAADSSEVAHHRRRRSTDAGADYVIDPFQG